MLIKTRLVLFCSAAISILFFSEYVWSQKRQTVKIPLKIEVNDQSKVKRAIFDDALKASESERSGETPTGSLITVRRDANDSMKFTVVVDTDGDGNLANEKENVLSADEKITFEIRKTKNAVAMPFELSFSENEKGAHFWWKPKFQARGEIKVKNCSSAIYLQDLNANGIFELLEDGTNLQIDRNNDGKIWGAEEWFYSQEIIDFCGRNFLIPTVALDGSYLLLQRTNLQIAKIGAQSPEFTATLLSGKKFSLGKPTDKPILLDFWASWCVPCVEKLPDAKSLEKDVSVYFINTDVSNRVVFAEQIVEKNNLRNNSVISGTGEDDVLWKTFARLNKSLPFYVLIDKQGVIIYAGYGGEKLNDLKAKIAEIKK